MLLLPCIFRRKVFCEQNTSLASINALNCRVFNSIYSWLFCKVKHIVCMRWGDATVCLKLGVLYGIRWAWKAFWEVLIGIIRQTHAAVMTHSSMLILNLWACLFHIFPNLSLSYPHVLIVLACGNILRPVCISRIHSWHIDAHFLTQCEEPIYYLLIWWFNVTSSACPATKWWLTPHIVLSSICSAMLIIYTSSEYLPRQLICTAADRHCSIEYDYILHA